MLYRDDIVSVNLQKWEKMIIKLAQFADSQDSHKRLTIYQFIYSIQEDIYQMKSLIESLHKKPGFKVQLKQGLIFEMYKKLSSKIAESKTVKQVFPETAVDSKARNESIDEEFDKTVQKIDDLSGESSDKFAEDMQVLIDKVDISLEDFEEWSSKNLAGRKKSFRKKFRKTLNKIHYYKYKSQAWIVRISEKSAESIEDIEKDLVKTCRSFRESWKKLNDMHTENK